nr:YbaN family protein [Nitrosomonas sp. Nm51]
MQLFEKNQLNTDRQALLGAETAGLLRLHHSPIIRSLYLGAGCVALMLGGLGVILPVLPTTPFVLLAAACFARGSERFHTRLMTNRYTGPIILQWRLHRSIPRKAKRLAYIMTALSFSVSILIVPEIWQKIMLATIACILAFCLSRIPVRECDSGDTSVHL